MGPGAAGEGRQVSLVMRWLTRKNLSPTPGRSQVRPCPDAQPSLFPVLLFLMASTLQIPLL